MFMQVGPKSNTGVLKRQEAEAELGLMWPQPPEIGREKDLNIPWSL